MTDTTASKIHSPVRRALLLALTSAPLIGACASSAIAGGGADAASLQTHTQDDLAALETASGGRLGVAAFNTADGAQLQYRGGERFPLCSTFKLIAASAILELSMREPALLQRRIKYAKSDFVAYSPITEKHIADGMTVADLCAAALRYSDNTAANLLMKILGGPAAVTAFARTIGDSELRLDRWETELNTAIPGDPRDTSTPLAMARDLRRLVLDDGLAPPQRDQLQRWLRGNTTGAARIRAGVPADWQVGDKTGTGDYGTSNDIGVLWPPAKPPIVLALYFTQRQPDAKPNDAVLASAARIVVKAFRQ
jgi:beta-lactamase class A